MDEWDFRLEISVIHLLCKVNYYFSSDLCQDISIQTTTLTLSVILEESGSPKLVVIL